ncbi:MAG TPA: SipW-dependent-type signal peptide-containing protein [Candidatus Avimonas sp.]|nr:SipW-dependent-type signal peptide-containing protein [Candidatus Avimonas sp.]
MQKFSTKRALLLNILSILACCALIAGTTLAWFTDTVASYRNRIVAGNLKVDLLMRGENGEYESIANGEGNIFSGGDNVNPTNHSLWEPGKTQVVYRAVMNLGTRALRYNILLDIEDKGLADALEFVVVNGDESSVVESWDSVAGQAQNLGELLASQGKRIIAAPYGQLDEEGATDYFALVVHMREDAGNQFQGKNIIINVTVVATQAAVESDSFDNKYDAGASFPVTTSEDLAKA